MDDATTTPREKTDADIASISDIIERITSQENTDRATCAVALLNVFITAADKLGGRRMFTTEDFIAYGTALAALNTIERPKVPNGRMVADRIGAEAVRTAVRQ